MRECDLLLALRRHFKSPEYAFLTKVADGTGSHAGRTIDAIAMSLWPSRGLELIGFECKTSRADWLRERSNPKKQESIFRFCHRFYLVTPDNVAGANEIPSTWGWLRVPEGAKKVCGQVQAPRLTPEPISLPFLAALLRRVNEQGADTALVETTVRERMEKAREEWERNYEWKTRNSQRELETLKRDVAAFEEQSGVEIRQYHGHEVGKAFKMASEIETLELRWERVKNQIADLYEITKNGT